MKGVINRGLQDLLEARYGPDVWLRVKARAGNTEPFFATSRSYPDADSVGLLQAAAAVTDTSVDDLLVAFGRRWITHTGPACYPSMFELAGRSAREFLSNMDRVHAMVTQSVHGARPPRFTCEALEGGGIRLIYRSDRGLTKAMLGLVQGVGDLFGEVLRIEETEATLEGAVHYALDVHFG